MVVRKNAAVAAVGIGTRLPGGRRWRTTAAAGPEVLPAAVQAWWRRQLPVGRKMGHEEDKGRRKNEMGRKIRE